MDFYKKYSGIPKTYEKDSEGYLVYDGKAYIKALEQYATDNSFDAAEVIADYYAHQTHMLSLYGNKKSGKK